MKINPLTRKKWNRFVSIRRGFFSFIIFLLFLFIISITSAWACTIGIINGSATTDGRPILWKSRAADTNVQVFNEDSYTC